MDPVAKAIWQHYRRHPLQCLLLLAGVIIGVVMVNGVALLNQQAYDSYRDGEKLMGMRAVAYIESTQARGSLPQSLYVELRNQGFNALIPVVSGTIQDAGGRRLSLAGTDPLAFSASDRLGRSDSEQVSLADFILPPYLVRVSPQRARQLGLAEGEQIPLRDGTRLAAISLAEEAGLGHRLWVDIGYAQKLLGIDSRISYIAVMDESQAARLENRLPAQVRLRMARDEFSLTEMTRSLHLNLTAMGLLAWVVGVFIVYNAVTFAYQDRLRLFGQLQIAGVPQAQLRRILVLELVGVGLVAVMIAAPLSVWLAQSLLPIFGRTLDNLYGVGVVYQSSWQPSVLIRAVLVAAAGILLSSIRPLYLIGRTLPLDGIQIQQRATHGQRMLNRFAALGVLLLVAAVLLAWLLPGLRSGFMVLALLLLGSAVCLPWLLSQMLAWLGVKLPPRWAVLRWSCGELNWQVSQSGLATMALVLALTANVGVNTMVGSFRDTVSSWLSQRLIADIYFRPDHKVERLLIWLQHHPDVDQVFIQKRVDTAVASVTDNNNNARAELSQMVSADREQAVHQALTVRFLVEDGWSAFVSGEGVFVSEREYLLNDRTPGSEVLLGQSKRPLRILGVYYDYGNPKGQMMLDRELFDSLFPGIEPAGVGVRLNRGADKSTFWQQALEENGLSESQLIDQQQMKRIALSVFEQTFTVTYALNLLTLLVAALGLMCALLLLGGRRCRGMAVLSSMGVSQRTLLSVSLLQWSGVGLLLALLSLPFGIALAWVLINLLNVYGFGWSYPISLQPQSYLNLMLASAIVTVLAALVPLIKQRRDSLSRQLSEEA